MSEEEVELQCEVAASPHDVITFDWWTTETHRDGTVSGTASKLGHNQHTVIVSKITILLFGYENHFGIEKLNPYK